MFAEIITNATFENTRNLLPNFQREKVSPSDQPDNLGAETGPYWQRCLERARHAAVNVCTRTRCYTRHPLAVEPPPPRLCTLLSIFQWKRARFAQKIVTDFGQKKTILPAEENMTESMSHPEMHCLASCLKPFVIPYCFDSRA